MRQIRYLPLSSVHEESLIIATGKGNRDIKDILTDYITLLNYWHKQ